MTTACDRMVSLLGGSIDPTIGTSTLPMKYDWILSNENDENSNIDNE